MLDTEEILPPELWLNVVNFIKHKSDLKNLSLTSTLFRSFVYKIWGPAGARRIHLGLWVDRGKAGGALGVTWRYRDQHAPAHGATRFVPFGDLDALDAALDGDVAAVITEPVQGIAGIVSPPAGWLAASRSASGSAKRPGSP